MVPPAPISLRRRFLASLPVLLWFPAQVGSLLLVTRWLPAAPASSLPSFKVIGYACVSYPKVSVKASLLSLQF